MLSGFSHAERLFIPLRGLWWYNRLLALNNRQLSRPANRPGRWGRGLGCFGCCLLLLMLLHPASNVGILADAELPGLLIAEALPFRATYIK